MVLPLAGNGSTNTISEMVLVLPLVLLLLPALSPFLMSILLRVRVWIEDQVESWHDMVVESEVQVRETVRVISNLSSKVSGV